MVGLLRSPRVPGVTAEPWEHQLCAPSAWDEPAPGSAQCCCLGNVSVECFSPSIWDKYPLKPGLALVPGSQLAALQGVLQQTRLLLLQGRPCGSTNPHCHGSNNATCPLHTQGLSLEAAVLCSVLFPFLPWHQQPSGSLCARLSSAVPTSDLAAAPHSHGHCHCFPTLTPPLPPPAPSLC